MKIYTYLFLFSVMALLSSCGPAGGDDPGNEYMPDMYHSIAYESNLYDYYSFNTWGTEDEYYKVAQPRKPVGGTVPRGYSGVPNLSQMGNQANAMAANYTDHFNGSASINGIKVPVNGSVKYSFPNTDTGRIMATNQLIDNPFPITTSGMEKGEELYSIFCGICHGESGNGLGYLVDDTKNKNVKYPAAPANFLNEEFLAASNGRYYHAIMYGKGVMGAYNGKISYEERWQVIHYIRKLQASELKKEYSGTANTLNPEFGTPGDSIKPLASGMHMQKFGWEMEGDELGHSHGGAHDEQKIDHGDAVHEGDPDKSINVVPIDKRPEQEDNHHDTGHDHGDHN